MAQKIPPGHFAKNIEPLGYHDLNGKPAFKLALQEVNRRWYLYVAHLWHRGWSVLELFVAASSTAESHGSPPQPQIAVGQLDGSAGEWECRRWQAPEIGCGIA